MPKGGSKPVPPKRREDFEYKPKDDCSWPEMESEGEGIWDKIEGWREEA